ncbi:MAG: C40 family peptidase [Actinomycetota bacterium]
MRRTLGAACAVLAIALLATAIPQASAHTHRRQIPAYVKPALSGLSALGAINKPYFRPNKSMSRDRFARLLRSTFGRGSAGGTGKVTAREVDAALVAILGQGAVANHLNHLRSADGWGPKVPSSFGPEIVARDLGLRYDHAPGDEQHEAAANDAMTQADILYAVWEAKTSPDMWAAEELATMELPDLSSSQKKVVQFAFSLAGTPYVWGGEWLNRTRAGYPYGAQPHGGVDCSGFSWYVLRASAPGWSPHRPYKGWSLPERSSAQMAEATRRKKRLGFKKLTAGDLVFFAPSGTHSSPSSVYHVGVYVGHGWMIDSSGSKDGVSLDYMGAGSWYRGQFIFGRRVIH